uniref:Uncharacterized protein n=1 Tax=virus sp. ctLl75 TaxID=2828249 RepID=A0A8S5RBM6_9VIRU|nr:MAG TPA: hypothetical protein [virus sp. ctLl75]
MVIIILNIGVSCIVPYSSCSSIVRKLECCNHSTSVPRCKKSHRVSPITRTLHSSLSLNIKISGN